MMFILKSQKPQFEQQDSKLSKWRIETRSGDNLEKKEGVNILNIKKSLHYFISIRHAITKNKQKPNICEDVEKL